MTGDGFDFMDEVIDWLCISHDLQGEVAVEMTAGLLIGLALASRHPAYAAAAQVIFTADYQNRMAGSKVLYEAMAIASGDERTSPEKMADELVEACPLPT